MHIQVSVCQRTAFLRHHNPFEDQRVSEDHIGNNMAENENTVEVIHAWCTPRSLSTSLMYSFAQVLLLLLLN